MSDFKPHIIPVYPPNNFKIFEEWFAENYNGCNTDRDLLPIFPTSFHVNNGYGAKKKELQGYCDTLPTDKRYFIICQYDDGCMVDWKGKDVLEFNMSKQNGVMLPLLCMPHPYKFSNEKKYIANFIGSRTHPIRNELEKFKGKEGWYISFEQHDIETYCRIISESIFTLCPRGYGANSFRICEALQYSSIPVYISDEFISPFNIDFSGYMVKVTKPATLDYEEGLGFSEQSIVVMQKIGEIAYEKYYTYEGCYNEIIKSLEAEYNSREAQAESSATP